MNMPMGQGEARIASSDAAGRLAAVVLARLAVAGASETQLVRDLSVAMGAAPDPSLRAKIARVVAALMASAHIVRSADDLVVTDAGRAAVVAWLGARKGLPAAWAAIRDGHLILRMLDAGEPTEPRLRLAAKLDGLRGLVVEAHWRLKLKGKPSASRIRQALSLVALGRAFGNQVTTGLGAKSAMSAKASRLLASQLSKKPRDFGTDGRLVAALAAEAVGARRSELVHLRQAIVRRFLSGEELAGSLAPEAARHAPPARVPQAGSPTSTGSGAQPAAPREITMPPPGPPAHVRPTPAVFAAAVKAAALECAEGWAGNRRAFVSHVWSIVQARHAEWRISEIEFKAMLVEAHRVGLVVLVNADLKDKRRLSDVEASAVSYKNTVWHYVRVED